MSDPVAFGTHDAIYNVYIDTKPYASSPDRVQAQRDFEEARYKAVDRVTLTEEKHIETYNKDGRLSYV